MPFITFIYRIGKNTYYGKYACRQLSDDHEGLDNEVRYNLLQALDEYRKQKNQPKLTAKVRIGVLSLSLNEYIPTYSSDKEKKCFDYYHIYYDNICETYINGKIINK